MLQPQQESTIAFDTYSNGVNAAGRVAQGMSSGDLESATVVGPNANSPAPVQAMDQADENTTQIYISINDGNLNTKTAPAPNQFSSATVTTSNHYDALNRLVAKTYSDGTTANVYYSFDVPPSWMTDLTNVVGRVASSNNQYGGTAGKGTANFVWPIYLLQRLSS